MRSGPMGRWPGPAVWQLMFDSSYTKTVVAFSIIYFPRRISGAYFSILDSRVLACFGAKK